MRKFLLKASIIKYLEDHRKAKQFNLHKISRDTIMIVEGNMLYHSEVLPGYVKYFNDLGYKCDVILSNYNLNSDPFCNANHLKYEIFGFHYFDSIVKLFSNHSQLDKYKHIFVSTTIILDGQDVVMDFVSSLKKDGERYKDKISTMIHSIFSIEQFHLHDYVKRNKVFVLSNFKTNNYPTLSPHYYGNANKNLPKNKVTRFLSVGRIDPSVKNYELLLSTVRKLLKQGISSFKVTFIGWSGNIKIDNDLAEHVEILGKVDFKTMHKEMENCDFVLSLLDPKHERHFLYSYDLASGSNLLSMAFNKPYLIQTLFASTSGFSTNNAVIYEDDDLFSAMKTAIDMDQNQYQSLKDGLEKLQEELYNTSISNIKKIIK